MQPAFRHNISYGKTRIHMGLSDSEKKMEDMFAGTGMAAISKEGHF